MVMEIVRDRKIVFFILAIYPDNCSVQNPHRCFFGGRLDGEPPGLEHVRHVFFAYEGHSDKRAWI